MGKRSQLLFAAILTTFCGVPVWGATPTQLIKYVSEAMVHVSWDDPNEGTTEGSGVVVHLPGYREKYVLTAHHVIEDAIEGKIPIKLQSHGMPKGKGEVTELAGWHIFHDLASYRLPKEMKTIRPIKFSFETLKRGERIAIFSFPFGQPSRSDGVVKRVRPILINSLFGPRLVPKYEFNNFVLSGSSGGMMLNREARLVGVVTHSTHSKRMGLVGGLGTPSPIILKLVDEAIKNGWTPKK